MEPYYRMLRKTLPRLLLLSDTSPEMQIFRNRALNIVPSSSAMPQDIQMRTMMATGGIGQVAQEQPSPEAIPIDASGVIGSETATPQQSVADDVPLTVSEGTFIINAPAAEYAGYEDIKKMLVDAVGVARRLGVPVTTGPENIKDDEAVDLLVSKGEIKVHPTLAKIIGYDRLEKINNRGKKEVARRQQEAAAAEEQQAAPAPQAPQAPMQQGGFVKKKFAEGGDVDSEKGLVERIADFLITPLNEGEDEQIAQLNSEFETKKAREQGEALGDVEAGFDILNRYPTEKNYKGVNYTPTTWDPVLQLALDDRRGLSGFVSREYELIDEASTIPYDGRYLTIPDSVFINKDEPLDNEYQDTLVHELMHKGQQNAGATRFGSSSSEYNFKKMEENRRFLHAVIAKKLLLHAEKAKNESLLEDNVGLLMDYLYDTELETLSRDLRYRLRGDKITYKDAAKELLSALDDNIDFRVTEFIADDQARNKLRERMQTAEQRKQVRDQIAKQRSKKAQGFADGGYTQSLTSNDVAERVASVIGVREDAQYAKDLSRLESSRQQFDDDDKSEDTLRHILLGGLVSPTNKDTLLGKVQGFLGGVGIEARERKNFIGDYVNEESAIDANNNKYGAALRKRYETQEEFEQAAIDAVIALREGKPIEIDGLTPRMSFGNPPKEESSRASQGN